MLWLVLVVSIVNCLLQVVSIHIFLRVQKEIIEVNTTNGKLLE